jgi:3-phenylpropionate/cinnamic acid dioxygenase small subunit
VKRIGCGEPGYGRAVDFLVDEAAALDDNRMEDWLELLHPDVTYRAPTRITRERAAGNGFSDESYHLLEDLDSLTTRVERLSTDYAWAEDPPSRARRFVTNFRVFDDAGDLRVHSNVLLYRERLDDGASHLMSAERRDTLRDTPGGLRLLNREVLLDHGLLGVPNLALFL